MRLVPRRVEVRGDLAASVALGGDRVRLGPLEVTLVPSASGDRIAWSIANTGAGPLRVRAVTLVFAIEDAAPPLRIFRHGWQSWSPTGVATFGVDRDPSHAAAALPGFVRGIFHADQDVVPTADELRAEWVTLLAAADGDAPTLVGFEEATTHDGTLRLRRGATGAPELHVEAFFGGVRLDAGAERAMHRIVVDARPGASGGEKLRDWAAAASHAGRARTTAPYQVGWCSWYHYFHDVTERDLRHNLAHAAAWPFEVFQLDDGFQAAIGDWLTTNERFPSGLPAIAQAIAAAGRRPGLWIAPFLVAPDSDVATKHPEWLARDEADAPLVGMWNPAWGGDGRMGVLDTTQPEVCAHLEALARALVAMGFTYLKLDFTFAPSLDGVWADGGRTPAERVRAGFAAIRRGAGPDAFILGCGVPLGPTVGIVDANRIGPDVAPSWDVPDADMPVPGYRETRPATRNAWRNTLARSFMHRALWLNDPDCVMLRTARTALSPHAAQTWATAAAVSGGMLLVSDDLALLDRASRGRLDELIAIGRASDADAAAGRPARCDDLLERDPPSHLAAAGLTLIGDPTTGTSSVRR